jgi:hypothetical protein
MTIRMNQTPAATRHMTDLRFRLSFDGATCANFLKTDDGVMRDAAFACGADTSDLLIDKTNATLEFTARNFAMADRVKGKVLEMLSSSPAPAVP